VIQDKHEDTMCKMGAIMAAGLLDAGGRNVTIGLRSRSGNNRMAAVIGMAVFTQVCSVALAAPGHLPPCTQSFTPDSHYRQRPLGETVD
jgi:hypothetical protein